MNNKKQTLTARLDCPHSGTNLAEYCEASFDALDQWSNANVYRREQDHPARRLWWYL